MCNRCEGRVALILAAALAGPIPDLMQDGAVAHQKATGTANDCASILGVIGAFVRDMKEMTDADSDKTAAQLSEAVGKMGLQRVANVFAFADHIDSAAHKIVDVVLDVMRKAADAGDVRAVTWLVENGEDLEHYGYAVRTEMVPVTRPNDDVSFMRPRGARPPVS